MSGILRYLLYHAAIRGTELGHFVPEGMEMGMRKVLGLVGATLLLAGPALAADLGRPPAYKAAPLAPVFSWTGLYIGVHGGYGWSDSQGLDLKGGFGGGQIGYNYQINNFVWGIEGDIAGGEISQNEPFGVPFVKVSFDTLASLRGRLGIAYGNALFYGTAGGGWGHFKISALGVSESTWLSGWTAGAGIEYAFLPNLSVKIEYLHYGFGSEDFLGLPTGNLDVDTIKAGINYRF
jgi:outer membrane immunogenic protein